MIVDIECPRCRGEGWLLQLAPSAWAGLVSEEFKTQDAEGYRT